jgi:hypothetical protein
MRRILRRSWVGAGATVLVFSGSAVALAASSPGVVGPRHDGTALTTYGWRVTQPAGSRHSAKSRSAPR